MAEFGNTFVNQTDLKMHLILFSEKKPHKLQATTHLKNKF